MQNGRVIRVERQPYSEDLLVKCDRLEQTGRKTIAETVANLGYQLTLIFCSTVRSPTSPLHSRLDTLSVGQLLGPPTSTAVDQEFGDLVTGVLTV
jgi:hypothetical protein